MKRIYNCQRDSWTSSSGYPVIITAMKQGKKTMACKEELEQKYEIVYKRLPDVIKRRTEEKRFMAMGYTSNLDFLSEFHVDILNELIEKNVKEADISQVKPGLKVKTLQELLLTLIYYAINGIGGEVEVENMGMLQELFPYSYGVGGTAVQAAMALSEIECPSIVHLTDDSKEVCDLLNTPFIYTVYKDMSHNPELYKDDADRQAFELRHTAAICQSQKQEQHFIVQFKKGERIRCGNKVFEIPCSNRLIFTKNSVNEEVPLSMEYLEWIETHGKNVSSNVLSSFNGILDVDVLNERLKVLRQHIMKYRQYNPEGIVFFEDAHYHNQDVRKKCFEAMCSLVDIVSMNEEELKSTLENLYDMRIDTADIISCVEAAKYIKKEFGVRKGVVVHTKDYSMYVGEHLSADIQSGLICGNLLAAAKAQYGWYGNMRQIEEVLRLELNPVGLESYKVISESIHAKDVILVPSKYIEKPKYTIGLGDCFLGGLQICF